MHFKLELLKVLFDRADLPRLFGVAQVIEVVVAVDAR
jgi:hypothetical protein